MSNTPSRQPRPDRPEFIDPDQDRNDEIRLPDGRPSIGNDTPTEPAKPDPGEEPVGRKDPARSVSDAFGIDDKNLHHPRSENDELNQAVNGLG